MFDYILTWQYLPENPQKSLSERPPLHSSSSREISRCVQHCFAKCFSHSGLSAVDGKLGVERPLYTKNSMSIRNGIKKGGFNGLKKIAGHMRPPFGSASLELWLTAPVLQLCHSPASGGCFGSTFMEASTERRTICDKSASLCYTSWHFPGQMYHSPPKISSHVANCYHCEESRQPGT